MLNNATVCYWNAKKKAAIPNSSITFQEKFPTQVLIRCSEGFAKFKLTSRGLCEHAKKSETLKSSCQASYQAAFSLWPPFYYHDPKLISIGKILLGVRRRSIHTLLHSNRILLFLEQHNIVLMPLFFLSKGGRTFLKFIVRKT